jgi:hypothetical protein
MQVMFAAFLDIKLRGVAIDAYRGKIFHGFQPRLRRLERRDRDALARPARPYTRGRGRGDHKRQGRAVVIAHERRIGG